MVNKSFQRVEDIERQIKNARLPYEAWKVLFTIDKQMNLEQIAEVLEEDQSVVDAALERLLQENLIVSAEVQEEEAAVSLEEATEEPAPVAEPEEREEAAAPPEVLEGLNEAESLISADELPEEAGAEEKAPAEAEPEEKTAPEELLFDAEEQPQEFAEEEAAEVEAEEEPAILQEEETAQEMIEKIAGETPAGEEEAVTETEPQAESELEINISEEEEEAEALDVDFSAEAAIEEEPVVPQAEEPPAAKGRQTILVVDDSIVIRKMVEIALEEEDYNLKTAVSGKEGLDKLDSANPDLVILDLMLPDINGIDILKAVKAGRKIPVIMLSGKDSPQMVEKAKAAGADAFLPKPFKDEELREQIKALITNG